MQGSTSIAGGATVNVLAGQQYEIVPFNCVVEFGITAAAAGLLATIFSATDLLMQSSPPAPTAAFPVYPDNFVATDVATKGDRLQISVNNPTGGSIVINWIVRLTPA